MRGEVQSFFFPFFFCQKNLEERGEGGESRIGGEWDHRSNPPVHQIRGPADDVRVN